MQKNESNTHIFTPPEGGFTPADVEEFEKLKLTKAEFETIKNQCLKSERK
jgi:16S rRNA U1498 N3-methylase RsmE